MNLNRNKTSIEEFNSLGNRPFINYQNVLRIALIITLAAFLYFAVGVQLGRVWANLAGI